MKLLSPAEIEAKRRNVPAELRTKDWDRIPLWVRERAFFMAGVANAEILQEFRNMSQALLRGEVSEEEARKHLRMFLRGKNYQPLPGQEGTIKDLRSVRRMQVALKTNARMMQGLAQWNRYSNSKVFPAMELVRVEARRVPRNWQQRWMEAAAKYPPKSVSVDPPMAVHGHPIWWDISRFGVPYPPFDFGSGMGQMPVRRDRAAQYLDLGVELPEMDEQSLNANLELTPQVSEESLRDALSENLKGYGKWEGRQLVFTDPNGTRKMTGEELAEVWERGLPEGFALHQRDRLVDWVRDSGKFHVDLGLRKLQPDTDGWEDFQRLIKRLENKQSPQELWRGLKMTNRQAAEGFIKNIGAGYGVRAIQPAESWSANKPASYVYAGVGDKGKKWAVILRYEKPQLAKDVTALIRNLEGEIGKDKVPKITQDAEWLLPLGSQLKVISVKRDNVQKLITVSLEDV